ncbi:hypothetical protein GQ53DRAFT_229253 [Thozetella sp. PMI_491]|nr:hypothetical protein GQ53DRAFT_229253 [Thozetella sp. PMI_491]
MNWSSSYTQIGAPVKPPVDRGCWSVTKIVLRCFSVIICGAIIAVEVSTLIEYERTYHSIADIAYFATPPALAAILWDKIEFLTLCIRRGRGVHPGAHVAVELILWLGCSGMGALILRAAWNVNNLLASIKAYYAASDDYNGIDYSSYSKGDIQGINNYVTKARAAGALLFLVAVIRFVLFVRACVETDNRRRVRKTPTIITTQYSEAHIPLAGVAAPQAYDPVAAFPSQPPPYEPKPAPIATAVPYGQPHYPYPPQSQFPPQYPPPHRYP